jgi:peptidoglycan hydrolase-like protein with peptidoglycan-binding domain
VPLLLGTLPAYRNLSVDSPDGDDVRQLEENLVALGHAAATASGEAETADRLTVDNHFDWATRAAVRRWQQALGADQTGAVAPTDFVVSAGPLRVAERTAAVGDDARPGSPLLKATSTDRTITVKLDVARQSLVQVGATVQVELPDHRVVPARVTAVSSVAETETDQSGKAGKSKVPVTISLDDPAAAGTLDQAPVSVRIVEHQASGVLAVPVKALLALQEGGYAVEVSSAGAHRYVPVTVGTFAGGLVEITGAVTVGDTVVVAQ